MRDAAIITIVLGRNTAAIRYPLYPATTRALGRHHGRDGQVARPKVTSN